MSNRSACLRAAICAAAIMAGKIHGETGTYDQGTGYKAQWDTLTGQCDFCDPAGTTLLLKNAGDVYVGWRPGNSTHEFVKGMETGGEETGTGPIDYIFFNLH
jgi:hypothetical protein